MNELNYVKLENIQQENKTLDIVVYLKQTKFIKDDIGSEKYTYPATAENFKEEVKKVFNKHNIDVERINKFYANKGYLKF